MAEGACGERQDRLGVAPLAQLARGFNAVQHGHLHVHEDRVIWLRSACRHAHGLRTVSRLLDDGALGLQKQPHREADRCTVFHHQHPVSCKPRPLAGRGVRHLALSRPCDTWKRQPEREPAAHSGLARHADCLASHQIDEAPADDEAQPRAAEAARIAHVELGEGLEQTVDLIRREADPCILHHEFYQWYFGSAANCAHAHDHLAAVRELEGIAKQVDQHLLEAQRVA